MLFEFNRFSSLLLVFFVHGLTYSILLFRKGFINENRSDKWLGIFLLLCILYISPWMVGFAGWYDTQPYRDFLFYTPFQHLYFIGPVIFFYVQSLLNPAFRFGKKEWLHLLPGLLYIIYSLVMVITDKLILKDYYFLSDGEDRDFDRWYQLTGLISMLFYFILSLRYYNLYRRLMVQVVSYADTLMFRWIRNFLLAFLLMLIVRAGFFTIGLFTDLDYWTSWWYFIVFAIIFYYIAITGYSNSIETKVAFKPNLLSYRPIMLLEEGPTEDAEVIELETIKTGDTVVDPVVKEWTAKLEALMINGKLYEDPELSLAQVAKQLQSNPSFISKMVNQGFGLNFNDFVNRFRVEAVIDLLKSGTHKTQTILSIAFEAGFNSKATFNRAFKKTTGQNPRDYIAALPSNSIT